MPFNGLLPFLCFFWWNWRKFWNCESMPFIGLSPFLLTDELTKRTKTKLWVNALYRAFSISTRRHHPRAFVYLDVSMLSIGLSPFLHCYIDDKPYYVMECQCSLSGFLHFYLEKAKKKIEQLVCVNALYRAFSISTLPSGNALKWSICRLDFAGNCLTTSKSAYFLLFLCLFTLCSYFVTVQHKKIIENTMSLFIVLLIIFLW